MRLGEIFLESGILTERQLARALDYSHSKLIPVGLVVKLFEIVPPEELSLCNRTCLLIRLGMPPLLAVEVLKEAVASKKPFDILLKEKLEGCADISPDLARDLFCAEFSAEEPAIPDLDNTPADELLRAGDKFFDDEHLRAAGRCFQSVRKRIESESGAKSDALTPVLRRLANLHMVNGQYPQAEELYKAILQTKQSIYGRHHVSVALAFEDLADLQVAKKKFSEAQQFYLQASTVHEKYLPDSLADFVGCLKKLVACSKELEHSGGHKKIGTLLTEAGLLSEEQLQKALKYAKQEKLPLGAVLRQECMIDERALQSFLEVQVLITDGVLSGEAAARAYKGSILSGIPLTKLLQDAGLLESLDNENRNLRLRLITELDELVAAEHGLGPNHREVAARAIRVGNVHVELGNLVEAENFFQRALNICSQDRKGNAALLAAASRQMGMLLMRSDRALQAEPLLMEALELLQASQQAETEDALEILQALALHYKKEQNLFMSWSMFNSALALCRKLKSFCVLSPDFLEDLNNCALDLTRDSDLEEIYMQTLRALRNSSSCEPRILCLLNMKLGDYYRDNGQKIKARAQYEIAEKIIGLNSTSSEVAAETELLRTRLALMKSARAATK